MGRKSSYVQLPSYLFITQSLINLYYQLKLRKDTKIVLSERKGNRMAGFVNMVLENLQNIEPILGPACSQRLLMMFPWMGWAAVDRGIFEAGAGFGVEWCTAGGV